MATLSSTRGRSQVCWTLIQICSTSPPPLLSQARHSTLDTRHPILANPRRPASPSSKRAASLCSVPYCPSTWHPPLLRPAIGGRQTPMPYSDSTSVDYQSMRIFQKPRLASPRHQRSSSTLQATRIAADGPTARRIHVRTASFRRAINRPALPSS
jgi:hypothetical protein